MEKRKPGREPCACDGTWDCFSCPYDECRVHGKYAVRGGIGEDIAAALGEERPSKRRVKNSSGVTYYESNKLARAEYQKRHRAENKARYARLQRLIKECRRARGWNQTELGDMVGVSQHTVSCWESGIVQADWDELERVMPELKQRRANDV